ncbi:MAG: response regulator, partial [Acetobacteraceae bacterium]|nr:response regulator [Acetobacteraceae bacterium]
RFSPRELLRQGQEAAGRASALVRQMLGFARRQPLSPAPLEPEAMADSLATMLRPAIGPRATLTMEIAPYVWPVLVDRQQFEVALLNLALNARDAMPDGGRVTLRVANRRAAEGGMVGFSLADSGTGMPPEVLARAREPFFTTKGVGKGTGLGLAMVHGFAEQSGGALRIESAPGAGTCVTILLPRLTEAAALLRAQAGEAPEIAAIERARHGGATILLVEDDPSVRPVTASFLRDLGYHVIEAAGAAEAHALAVAMEEAIDLVVTDVMMPGEDGAGLATRLRRDRPDLPVLFITGHAERDRLPPGAAVLGKPFTQEALAACLLERLGRLAAPRAGAPDGEDRLARRIRGAGALGLLGAWREAVAAMGGGRLPPPGALLGEPWNGRADRPRGRMVLVAVDRRTDPPGLHCVGVGPALEAALGRRLTDADLVAEVCDDTGSVPGSIAVSYLACAESARPVYDYARFGGMEAGAPPVLFERLLLPCSEEGGGRVTHIVGMVFISDPAQKT